MGIRRSVGFYGSTFVGRFALFCEEADGMFTKIVESGNETVETASDAQLRIVGVPLQNGISVNTWQVYGTGYAITTPNLVTFTSSYESDIGYARINTQYAAAQSIVQVVDEHGVTFGSPSGNYPRQAQVGFIHRSTNNGYTFLGYKLTWQGQGDLKGEILSTGYTESGLDNFFPADYQGAVVIKLPWIVGANTILTAQYEKIVTKTVSYISDGATFATTQCTTGGKYILPYQTPTKSGFAFAGWFTAQTGGDEISAETQFTSSSPTTIYAQWIEIPVETHAITLNAAGGVFLDGTSTKVFLVEDGDSFVFEDEPSKSGNRFLGWSNGTTVYHTGDSFSPTEDAEFSAVWYMVPGNGSLSFSSSGGSLTFTNTGALCCN